MLEVKIECGNYIIQTNREETEQECLNSVINLDIESWNDDLKRLTEYCPIYWTIYNEKGKEIAQGTREQLL